MPKIIAFGVLLLSYLLGAIPFGLIIVRLKTGLDVRKIESGRTGGTNVMRAAGFGAGFVTAVLDILKGAVTVWLVRWLAGRGLVLSTPWLEVLAPAFAVLGHNYSIFLIEPTGRGGYRLRGGAGGATTVGGALALWPPSILVVIPVGLIFLFGVGYASLATLSVALSSGLIFAYRAWQGVSPWEYVAYSLITGALLAWALRPNLKRLANGTERLVGWRARRLRRLIEESQNSSPVNHSSSPSSSSS